MRPVISAALIAAVAGASSFAQIPAAQAAAGGVPKGTITAKVVKIVDGDTLDVRYRGKVRRVQLLGVDTPERGRCWFREATARTAALLKVGKGVRLLKDRKQRDRYGRWLYYAWNPAGVFVNRNLVRYGFGKAVLHRPNDRFIGLLRAEEAKAKRERLRIWSGKCGPSGGKKPGGIGSGGTGTGGGGTGTGGKGGGGIDPRYRTCREANAAGYGPYYRGRDPEYYWYQDRDRDGVVCER